MNEMKLFKEDGFPSEAGLIVLQSMKNSIETLFDSNLVSNLSDTQVRLLGSWLSKLVGDEVLDVLKRRSK